jgi:hypothetical protein
LAHFQSFWYGDDLPPYQCLAIKSFIDHGHSYDLYAYRAFDVPKGTNLRDAGKVLPHQRVFFYGEGAGPGRGSVSAFSNLFRYHLLCASGGWWVDTDVICLSESIPDTSFFVGWEYEGQANGALLKTPAQHPLIRLLRDNAEKTASDDLVWGAIGPALITKLVNDLNLGDLVSEQAFAYPIQSANALDLLLPSRFTEVETRVRDKPFLHLWNEVFRRAGILPWVAPPPGSFMDALFKRHEASFGPVRSYTADQVQRLSDQYIACTPWARPFIAEEDLDAVAGRLGLSSLST